MNESTQRGKTHVWPVTGIVIPLAFIRRQLLRLCLKNTGHVDEDGGGGQQQDCREHYYCFHLIYLLASSVGDPWNIELQVQKMT
jgi:hypothetical protein